jgi:phosphohistidine phosphatase
MAADYRRLILMRHAKSSWADESRRDHDRPLNDRGRRDAPRVAQALLDRNWAPKHVHASDARRTRETWTLMAPLLPPATWVMSRALYLEGIDAIRQAAAHFPRGRGPVLLLGHNPGWEEAVAELTGQPTTLTTGNAVMLEGNGRSWEQALLGSWEISGIIRPRDLHRQAP